jgi:hypothetical protein
MCLRETVRRESRELAELIELMRGHWECFEAPDECVWALEQALRDGPHRDPSS